jgi:hypothetical protein
VAVLEHEDVRRTAGSARPKSFTRARFAAPTLLEGRLIGRVHVTFDERGDVLEYVLLKCRDEDELRAIWRAMMLATSAEILDALLAGEAVPIDQLDPEWVARFDRKQAV